MAVLITAAPAPPTQLQPARQTANQTAPADPVCRRVQFDQKFVHFVEKTPSEKNAPGFRLIAQDLASPPVVTEKASGCVIEVTGPDLVR
jgi:hypothetical protein